MALSCHIPEILSQAIFKEYLYITVYVGVWKRLELHYYILRSLNVKKMVVDVFK